MEKINEMQRGGELTYLNIQVWEHITVNMIILSGVTVIFRWIRGYRLNYSSIYQVFIWLVRNSSFLVNVIFIAATVNANETLKFCKEKKKWKLDISNQYGFRNLKEGFNMSFGTPHVFQQQNKISNSLGGVWFVFSNNHF